MIVAVVKAVGAKKINEYLAQLSTWRHINFFDHNLDYERNKQYKQDGVKSGNVIDPRYLWMRLIPLLLHFPPSKFKSVSPRGQARLTQTLSSLRCHIRVIKLGPTWKHCFFPLRGGKLLWHTAGTIPVFSHLPQTKRGRRMWRGQKS